MRILVGIGHPKQVHFWRNIINNLVDRGHEIKIVAVDKDIVQYLLNAYGFKYELIGKNYKGLLKKAFGMFTSDLNILRIIYKFKPDVLVGGAPHLAHGSRFINKPHITFMDTENAKLANWLSFPFSDVVVTPSCYTGKIENKKHKTFKGYMELAYLHPNYFKPDASILDNLGLDLNSKFIIIRFVAWDASHDIGEKGFTDMANIIGSLEKYSKVLISSEKKLPKRYEKYQISIPPEKMHHLMYFAGLYIGESPSMACESAILGTPAILVSTSRRGYTDELESRYDMLYNFSDPITSQENALNKAIELLNDEETKIKWQTKRERLLKENIDVTKFVSNFIEEYVDNFKKF